MNILKDKSRFNREAAELCLKNSLYSPSIHCSYYSCIQYMLYILFEKLKITEEEFNKKRARLNTGTHLSVIKLIGRDLIRKEGLDYTSFQKLIRELKKLREKSDYKNLKINQEEGWIAINHSDSIKNILTKNYK